jgi:hypothetical protein
MDNAQSWRHGNQRKRSASTPDRQECRQTPEHSTLSRCIMPITPTFRRSSIPQWMISETSEIWAWCTVKTWTFRRSFIPQWPYSLLFGPGRYSVSYNSLDGDQAFVWLAFTYTQSELTQIVMSRARDPNPWPQCSIGRGYCVPRAVTGLIDHCRRHVWSLKKLNKTWIPEVSLCLVSSPWPTDRCCHRAWLPCTLLENKWRLPLLEIASALDRRRGFSSTRVSDWRDVITSRTFWRRTFITMTPCSPLE